MSKYSNKEAVHNFIHEALVTASSEYEKKEETIRLQKANTPQFHGFVKEEDVERIIDAFLSYQEALEKSRSQGAEETGAVVSTSKEGCSDGKSRKSILQKIVNHFDKLTDELYEYWKRTEKPDCD